MTAASLRRRRACWWGCRGCSCGTPANRWGSRKSMRPQAVNRVSAGLVLFFLLFALTIDLYWLVNHQRLSALADAHWMARIYRNYSTADRAYYDRAGKLE